MRTTEILCVCALLALSGGAGAAPAKPAVSEARRAELVRLYEEEILARDLYLALGKVHRDMRPFQNIPRAESAHREAMAGVLARSGIPLPKAPAGRRFVSEGLDATYEQWWKEGRQSEADAARVGVRLEEHDIADLRAAQSRAADDAERSVLAALEQASGHHLAAFHRNLAARGGTYAPEALKASDFRRITAAGPGCGRGAR